MRRSFSKSLQIAVVMVALLTAVFSALPALAMDPTDGRYEPSIDDRLAVYVHDDGIEVWGIDSNLNGVYLVSFSAAALHNAGTLVAETEYGTVTLVQDVAAVFTTGYDEIQAAEVTIVSEPAEYTITWNGGSLGADGGWQFTKTVEAAY